MRYFNGATEQELKELLETLQKKMAQYHSMNLDLDMSRGKPCQEQLELSNPMMTQKIDFATPECRNYGILDGIEEAKLAFKDMLGVSQEELIIGGNSSLQLMYDAIAKAMLFGTLDSQKPWVQYPKIKFLCPVPGYDRHFGICQEFNIEMINIPLKKDGPDMDLVESLVQTDDTIKGIWCMPQYANPTGICYSDIVIRRLANMETAAQDFRIFWDNAYAVHHFTESGISIGNILEECKKSGNPNRPYLFTSTSKITFPGAGIGMMAGSVENMNFIRKQLSKQTIGSNKVNQLLHAKFLPNMEAMKKHMMKHADIIAPKFEMVHNILTKHVGGLNIASWTDPLGGYFISLNVVPGCAKQVVQECAKLGVKLTPAGATFPYGNDPADENIRIAPSYPPIYDLEIAMEVLGVVIQAVVIEKLLAQGE